MLLTARTRTPSDSRPVPVRRHCITSIELSKALPRSGLRSAGALGAARTRRAAPRDEPRVRRAAAIWRVGAFRYDGRKPEPTCLAVEALAVPLDVVAVADAARRTARQKTQQLLAGAKRRAAQVPAVEVQEIDDDEHDLIGVVVCERALEADAIADAVLVEDRDDAV